MDRSVCRGMMDVTGLAVLGMTATLAGAKTVEVKERPPAVQVCIRARASPRARWDSISEENATGPPKDPGRPALHPSDPSSAAATMRRTRCTIRWKASPTTTGSRATRSRA